MRGDRWNPHAEPGSIGAAGDTVFELFCDVAPVQSELVVDLYGLHRAHDGHVAFTHADAAVAAELSGSVEITRLRYRWVSEGSSGEQV